MYQKYIREFAFKKLLRYLFFSKNYSIFPRGGLWSPPPSPGYDNFLPPPPTPRIGLAKQRGFSVFTIFASHLCVNNSPKRNLNNRHLVISGLASQHQHWHCIFFLFLASRCFFVEKIDHLYCLLWLVSQYHYQLAKIVFPYDFLFIHP